MSLGEAVAKQAVQKPKRSRPSNGMLISELLPPETLADLGIPTESTPNARFDPVRYYPLEES